MVSAKALRLERPAWCVLEKQGSQRCCTKGMEKARERRKDLVGLDFVSSRRGCWDPSPEPQSSEYEPFLPLNLSALIYKMGTWVDMQLGTQQNRELVLLLLGSM